MIPKRQTDKVQFQPNRMFDSIAEMESWVKNNYPGARILQYWKCERIGCKIEVEVKAKAKK